MKALAVLARLFARRPKVQGPSPDAEDTGKGASALSQSAEANTTHAPTRKGRQSGSWLRRMVNPALRKHAAPACLLARLENGVEVIYALHGDGRAERIQEVPADCALVLSATDDDLRIVAPGNLSHAAGKSLLVREAALFEALDALDTTIAALARAIETGTESDNPGLVQEVVCCILRHACYRGASDVYLSRTALGGTVRMKRDGTGEAVRSLPDVVYERVMTMLAGSSGATERLATGPVDTRVTVDSPAVVEKFADILNRYNFRMAITPAMKKRLLAVIRIQDAKAQEVEFDSIGFDARTSEILRGWSRRPAGLVLVTGPTGSGKTTSLYSMLQLIDPLSKQVASVENPVEAEFGMWAQQEIEVKGDAKEGEVFHRQLVSLLRQAPDVILLGEMRDGKMVETVLAAANTGHLVFTTLHTNSAAGTILRLREMKASTDALAYTLIGVLAQRLVPTLCPHCKVPDTRDAVTRELDQPWLSGVSKTPKRRTETGCERCGWTGIRGRRMVYEILEGDKVRSLIETGAGIARIHDAGIQNGQSMWARGLTLVAGGLVDFDELLDRVERSS